MHLKMLARRFAQIWHREKRAKTEKRDVAEILKEKLRDAGLLEIDLGKESVIVVSDLKKEPTKADIVAFFGEEQAEAFWSKLKAKTCEYLTVAPVKAKKKAV